MDESKQLLDQLLQDYDSRQFYPMEIVDKGRVVGEELYYGIIKNAHQVHNRIII